MHTHYLTPDGTATVAAAIAAKRAHLAELRAQRPFRQLGRTKVIDLAALRRGRATLVATGNRTMAQALEDAAKAQAPRRFTGAAITGFGAFA